MRSDDSQDIYFYHPRCIEERLNYDVTMICNYLKDILNRTRVKNNYIQESSNCLLLPSGRYEQSELKLPKVFLGRLGREEKLFPLRPLRLIIYPKYS